MIQRPLSFAIYALAALVGLIAFLYPLFIGGLIQSRGIESSPADGIASNPSILTLLLLVIGLVALVVEVQGQAINTKVLAALGILVAIGAVLRFLETAIPGPAGFSPIFVPIILAGYVYGGRFGFLMGILTLLTSALITGGIGPWLPYQMFTAGWIGMSSGWLPHPRDSHKQLTILIIFSFVWGILFGAILNLYFWPFLTGEEGVSWAANGGLGGIVARYGAYYLATSLVWDLARAFGNGLLMMAIGLPALRALSRFKDRIQFEVL